MSLRNFTFSEMIVGLLVACHIASLIPKSIIEVGRFYFVHSHMLCDELGAAARVLMLDLTGE